MTSNGVNSTSDGLNINHRHKRRRTETEEARLKTSLNPADDKRIYQVSPLIPPQILTEEVAMTPAALDTVTRARQEVEAVLDGRDDRLVVIVGPCSIHDVTAARDYGEKLKAQITKHQKDLLIIMRVYFEKPRSVVGWKGLLNDPDLDGTFKINKGLRLGRQLLLDLNADGVPAGVEFLDMLTPQWMADLVSWGAIGARTTESQTHRELASALSCPVGFKNGTGGSVGIAVDAIRCSANPHHFLSVTKQGLSAIVHSEGNPYCHIILRGGANGPNYDAESVQETAAALRKSEANCKIMIDCSHGNSRKIHTNQPGVARSVGEQIASGNADIMGVMLESFLIEGNQKLPPEGGLQKLKYGQSITDACIGWGDTLQVLDGLAAAVRERRARK